MCSSSFRLALLLAIGSLACASTTSTPGAASEGDGTAEKAAPRPSCGQATPYFEFQVERPAVRRSGPKPPSRASKYMAQFIVDESGLPDSASFRLIAQGDRDAAQGQRWGTIRDSTAFTSAWRAVAASTFRPAEIRGCTVRMLVQEPATLTLASGSGT